MEKSGKPKLKPKLSRRFIYIVGPEGVGKSTQARLLRNWLISVGYRVKIVCIRTRHLALQLFRFFVREYFSKACEVGTWGGASAREKKLYPLIFLLEVLNAVLLSLVRVFTPLLLGYIVVCENYVLDTLTDLQRDYRRFSLNKGAFLYAAKILLRLIPRNHLIIVLDASYEELLNRYKIRGSLAEPLSYISIRRNQLLLLAKPFNHYYINTEGKSPIEVSEVIREIISDTYTAR